MITVVTIECDDLSPIFAMLLCVFGIGLLTVLIGKAIDTLSARKRMKEE